jgi:hypothetical protein
MTHLCHKNMPSKRNKKTRFEKLRPKDYTTKFETWLVHERSRIQNSMLKLANYYVARRTCLKARSDESIAYAWLLGAAFSLWRAVFLAYESLDQPSNLDAAAKLLWTVIRDNAVTYQTEKNSWSSGYYLGSAQFRIIAAHERLRAAEFADHPTVPVTPVHSLGGRNQSESAVAISRCVQVDL